MTTPCLGRIRDFFLVSRINVAEYVDAWEQLSPSLFLDMVVIVVARRFSALFNGVIYAVLKESAFDNFLTSLLDSKVSSCLQCFPRILLNVPFVLYVHQSKRLTIEYHFLVQRKALKSLN